MTRSSAVIHAPEVASVGKTEEELKAQDRLREVGGPDGSVGAVSGGE
jgi:pyruvate/2-oxoglutarate dehydrogenase complex dihydrolipoamide dehydrogenase (E3) component